MTVLNAGDAVSIINQITTLPHWVSCKNKVINTVPKIQCGSAWTICTVPIRERVGGTELTAVALKIIIFSQTLLTGLLDWIGEGAMLGDASPFNNSVVCLTILAIEQICVKMVNLVSTASWKEVFRS